MSGRLRALADSPAARLVALGAVAFALALVSILFTREHGRVAAIWPGNALALAILLRSPPRAWAGYLVAVMAALFGANLAIGDPPVRSAALALCNGAEILVAAALTRRMLGSAMDPTRPWHLLEFSAAAALAPLISAAPAAAVLAGDAGADFVRWYLADALGLLLVTPALLAVADDHASLKDPALARRSLAPAVALAGALAITFGQDTYPTLFLIFPPLLWCAFVMGAAGTSLALLATSVVAVVATLTGHGTTVMIPGGLSAKLTVLQLLLASIVMVSLPLTAVLAERRRLTESLRKALAQATESEARYRMLAENASDVVLKVDREATIVYASPSVAQFGYAPEEMVGRSAYDFIHPEDRDQVVARTGGMLRDGVIDPALSRIYRLRTRDGGHVWAEGSPSIVRDAEGQVEAVVSQIRDITAHKEAEVALAESEARYRVLADHATDVILKVDAEDTILYVSPSASRYGYAPEDLIGRCGYTIVHPDDLPKLRGLIAELFRAGVVDTARDRTYRIRTADGGWVWMEGSPSIVRNAAGEVEAVISQLRDVSVRKRLEAELLAARDDAQAAAATKAEFMANMSHEIRTPLTAVLGFTSLLARRAELSDDARSQVGRIAAAGEAMLAIVNDILDFSKLEAGLMPVTPRPAPPREILENALALFEPQAAAKGLRLAFEVRDLPEQVRLDPDRVRQVLLNLIGNAVKFTETGEVAVTARYDHVAERLHVAVRDSGAGMTEAQQAKLFQRFSQVDGAAARTGGGTGLGLAISLGLVEAMGGKIGLTSAPGAGSTFAFEIPAPLCAATESIADAAPLAGVAGLRVLVADDNATNRELAQAVMAQFEIEVTDAPDGATAVELAGLLPYDVILLDIRMPGMDGPEAARRIRGAPGPNQTTPILAFSADHELDEAVAGLFDGHVRKPIEVAPLLTALAEVTAWEEALAAEG